MENYLASLNGKLISPEYNFITVTFAGRQVGNREKGLDGRDLFKYFHCELGIIMAVMEGKRRWKTKEKLRGKIQLFCFLRRASLLVPWKNKDDNELKAKHEIKITQNYVGLGWGNQAGAARDVRLRMLSERILTIYNLFGLDKRLDLIRISPYVTRETCS